MPQAKREDRSGGFERRDVSSIGIGVVGFSVIILVWVLFGAVASYFRYLRRESPPRSPVETSVLQARELPPAPRIQEDPKAELDDYLKKERALLDSYGWVDRRAGIARVPIARATEILSHERR